MYNKAQGEEEGFEFGNDRKKPGTRGEASNGIQEHYADDQSVSQ